MLLMRTRKVTWSAHEIVVHLTDLSSGSKALNYGMGLHLLIDFSLTVKAATLIFISGRGLAISSAKEGKSGFIYNLIKS